MNKKDWNKIAKNYYEEIISPLKDAEKNNPLEKHIKKLKKTNKTAIDLGCGTGPLLPKLSKKYELLYGVDYSEGMVRKAKKEN